MLALTHSQAAYRNLPAMCEMLIRFGTDVNAQNRQGQTALHLVRARVSHELCRIRGFEGDVILKIRESCWILDAFVTMTSVFVCG